MSPGSYKQLQAMTLLFEIRIKNLEKMNFRKLKTSEVTKMIKTRQILRPTRYEGNFVSNKSVANIKPEFQFADNFLISII